MNEQMNRAGYDWDIFCRVVDNLGDIGVTWRLARGLADDHGLAVRLWVDDWEALRRLCPAVPDRADRALIDGIVVQRWGQDFPVVEPARNVIEAFACDLPERYLEAMALCEPVPVWINLEYLSAEAWVEDCHRGSSPHPRLPLIKHFFFPGFTAQTGGLLRERGLLAARDRLQSNAVDRFAFLEKLAGQPIVPGTFVISLFAYEQAELPALLELWSQSGQPHLLLVPEGRVLGDVARFLERSMVRVGECFSRGSLGVVVLPFLSQDDYDRLLWVCDLNFVRGEDSFVRAQWAAQALVWHIYRQDEDAHLVKLDAFLDLYLAGVDPVSAAAVRAWWHAWNGRGALVSRWPAFSAAVPVLRRHAKNWAAKLASGDDLASSLVQFSKLKLK